MASVSVTIMHPTDGRTAKVTLDNTMSAQEVIDNLIENGFLKPNPQGGYALAIKGGSQLPATQTLADANVRDEQALRVVPETDAGSLQVG